MNLNPRNNFYIHNGKKPSRNKIIIGALFVTILIGGVFGGSYTVFAGGGGHHCGGLLSKWQVTSNSGCNGGGGGPAPRTTATISVTPTSINQGGSATISWSSAYANFCQGTNFNTGNRTSGSVQVSPSVATTYSVRCAN